MIGRQEDLVADQERNLERQREEGVERMGCARINAHPETGAAEIPTDRDRRRH